MEEQILIYLGSLIVAAFISIFPACAICFPMDNEEYKDLKFCKIWNIIAYSLCTIFVWYELNFSDFSKLLEKKDFGVIAFFTLLVILGIIVVKICKFIEKAINSWFNKK